MLLFSFLILINGASAQSNDDPFLPKSQDYLENELKIIEPGVLPTSFWYWADVFTEEIRYVFTMTKKSKGDFLIEVSEERLAEMQVLSEQGINKYAERLVTKHEEAIKHATELYKQAKIVGWEKLQQGQTDLERNILLNEAKVKVRAKDAPAQYEKGRDTAIGAVGQWFGQVLSHLNWKRSEIKQQRASVLGEE